MAIVKTNVALLTSTSPFNVPAGQHRLLTAHVIGGTATITYNGVALTDGGAESGFGRYYLAVPPVGTFSLAISGLTGRAVAVRAFTGAEIVSNPFTSIFYNGNYFQGGSIQGAAYSDLRTQGVATNYYVFSGYTYTGSGSGGGGTAGPLLTPGATVEINQDLGFNGLSYACGENGIKVNGASFTGGAGQFQSGTLGYEIPSTSFMPVHESLPWAVPVGENTSDIKYNGATLNSNITTNGYSTNTYIEYGLTTSYGSVLPTTTGSSYSQAVTGLTANTLYYYRVIADNGNGVENGSDFTFTTLPTPTTTTSASSLVALTSATLNGFVTNGNVAGTHYFQYGTSTGIYTNTTTSTSNSASASSQSISASITGLTTSVPIFYRTVLIVDGITYNGAEMSFTPGAAPIISLGAISALTNTTVTLNGLVNPGGLATNYQFQYGTTVALGTNTTLTSAGAGTSDVAVNFPVTGLSQNTTYYYRLTAVNASGINNTAISSFTTNGMATISSFTVSDPVVYTTNTFNFTQEINDTSGTYIINYGIAPSTYTLSLNGSITADGSLSHEVTGLVPNTTYYAQLSITNSFGTTNSSEIVFSTFATTFTTIWTNTDTEPATTWVNET